MEKIIYLVNGLPSETHEQFKNRVFDALNLLAKNEKPGSLKVVLTENPPPSISIIPFKKQKIASISVFQKNKTLSEILLKIQGFSGVYQVTEALPVAYEKTWEDGEPTPGVNLLTLFRQKKGITYETFLDRWHNSHTPLSLRLHPLWNYNRNVVNEKLSDNSTNWDGIVEEHFRTKSELLNPFKFFGKPLSIIPNMLEVYTDTKAFLDYKTIETYLATEYHIVSSKS
ncbi:MAG TPA: hypothetical protein VIN10_09720 [Bacteroidales bacterium]